MKSLSMVLVIFAIVVGSAFATQTAPTHAVPNSSMNTPPICAETTSEPPILPASNYRECLDSYRDCVAGCQAYTEPTQTQCENWCFQNHWCVQV